jgi:ribonuclease III
MDQAVDLDLGRALGADRGRLLKGDLDAWLAATFGRAPADRGLFERALTHGSEARANYERLEFLGDRVLGLVIAEWLYTRFPDEPEGNLSKRTNALVARATCAEVGRALGVPAHVRLGKQARNDGAAASDNVIGDVLEALIGALYLDAGHDAARAFVRSAWGDRIDRARAPQHPKAALQEWAAAHNRRPPEYEVVDRSGPGHAQRFTVRVAIGKLGDATGEGSSKQEAETAAAAALLGKVSR